MRSLLLELPLPFPPGFPGTGFTLPLGADECVDPLTVELCLGA
jgi:hypothetical protein